MAKEPASLNEMLGEIAHDVAAQRAGNGQGVVPVGGDVGIHNIEQATGMCAKALTEIFEECAKRFEQAIEAEKKLHDDVVGQLAHNAAECRRQGEHVAAWLNDRGSTAVQVAGNAATARKALEDSIR
jgi:hypothetical protein